ncbi:hypothetical protein MRX96_025785 [Rhipicephalus microplus]
MVSRSMLHRSLRPCRKLKSEDTSDSGDPVRASWSPIGHRGGFEPLLVSCPTRRKDLLPRLVSLVYMGVDGNGWLRPRKVELVPKRSGTFAVCVTVGDQGDPDPRMLAEFLAFYDVLGASRYVFYVRSLGTGLDYLSALQRKYEETTSTKDKLRVRLDVAQGRR